MDLYPPIEPYRHFSLSVSDLHTLYVEECGTAAGKPALFLHGGPGRGIDPTYRQYFNPNKWRLILFDQRGCGKSTPTGELRQNTTWDLVADIERIRSELGIENWVVFGGSWGSTLALAYAQTHPNRIKALILRGVVLFRQMELDWFYRWGTSRTFPEAFERYRACIPEAERADLLQAYLVRLTSPDRATRLAAARAWCRWGVSASRLIPNPAHAEHIDRDDTIDSYARIECHYAINKGFFASDGQLLHHAHRMRGIPGVIVQGRYDVLCTVEPAWELHRVWPESILEIIPDAGHSISEPGIRAALIKYTEQFSDL